MKIQLESGCALEVAGEFYMFQAEGLEYCLGVYADPSTVIGNNFLQGHSVVFDLEKRRWGVAVANISDLGNLESFTHCSANEAIQTQNHEDITMPLLKRKEKGLSLSKMENSVAGKSYEAIRSEMSDGEREGNRMGNLGKSTPKPSQSVSKMENTQKQSSPSTVLNSNMKSKPKIDPDNDSSKPAPTESVASIEATGASSLSASSTSLIQNKTAGKSGKLMELLTEKEKEENLVMVNKGQLRVPSVAKVSDAALRKCRVVLSELLIGLLANVILILSVCFVFFLVVKYSFFWVCFIHFYTF